MERSSFGFAIYHPKILGLANFAGAYAFPWTGPAIHKPVTVYHAFSARACDKRQLFCPALATGTKETRRKIVTLLRSWPVL
jgi:hypothetical protein